MIKTEHTPEEKRIALKLLWDRFPGCDVEKLYEDVMQLRRTQRQGEIEMESWERHDGN